MTPFKAVLGSAALVLACSSSGEESSGTGAGGAPSGGGSNAGAGGQTSGSGASAGATMNSGGDAGRETGGAAQSGGSSGTTAGAAGETQGGAGGAPIVKENCGAENPAGCYRGMYVSPYTDHIGQVTFAGEDLVYANILGDEAKEQKLFDFIAAQQIDSLSLYNLHVILADDGLTDDLESFVMRARGVGVLRIEAIGADSSAAWDAIYDFHQNRAPFDGFVTEIEFWTPAGDFQVFIDTLEYIRDFDWAPAPSGDAPTLSAYLGWPDAAEVETMAPLLDRAYLHAYVSTAPQAYGYVDERVGFFDAANTELGTDVAVWPIYSAEDDDWAAGAEYFMGEWLGDNGMAAAESEFMTDWAAEAPEGIVLGGHQYYEYFFLSKYLN
jgi:hypothetical protein